MNYSEKYSKSKFKGSRALYIIAACCLLAIGGASWFAASEIKSRENDKNNSSIYTPPSESSKIPENTEEPIASEPFTDAGENVSSEPFTSSQEKPATPETKKASNFTMPIQGEIIKPYSEKELQYSATFGDMRLHSGIDIACEVGTSVGSCFDGTVVAIEEDAFLGKTVTIDHGNGITAKYAGLNEIKLKQGATVSVGDIIGTVGTVPGECADQSHLHFEVYKNNHVASPLDTLKLK